VTGIMSDRDIVSTLALDRLAEGVLLIDDSGMIAYANSEAAHLFGKSLEDLLGTAFSLPVRTEDEVEIYIPSAQGRVLTVQMQVVPLDADGKSLSLISLHDVTTVIEAKRALEAERRALEDSNRNLEEFASAISHDLQQPLNTIAGLLQILEMNAKDRLTEDDKASIDSAVKGILRMNDMIHGLLNYAWIHAHGQPMEPVQGRKILDKAVANLRGAIDAAGAIVTFEPLPTFLGDESQLVSLFQNLIDNGLKYRSPDRVPSIHVTVDTRDPGQAIVSFKDNGIGIPRESFKRIFSTFKRLQDNASCPGVGLGLAICKRIVERHGGSIWLESQLGAGTTFHVALPQEMQMLSKGMSTAKRAAGPT